MDTCWAGVPRCRKGRIIGAKHPLSKEKSYLAHPWAGLWLVPRPVLSRRVLLTYLLLVVTPGQSSVRKGEAGRPAPLTRLQMGLSAQA